ncbi:FkbM family methyltransferase [Stieleria varia]|uniref:Methyltransferase FkbM domain-containing protein n=1 Tax=Stieleria varia TaxID=2528005 RepID=A0A5C5ZPY7_9BACT|nr:FkbM family methyltransferase [Stieleria varia]TWT89256.1 hypothetical protein Pla52n_68530 [Stieleria varia]
MRKVLFDLGAHHGESLEPLAIRLGIDSDWEIHLFEPNPECFLVERMRGSKLGTERDIQVHNAAVWIEDGRIQFSQQNHRLARNRSPTDGRSEIDGWGSAITSLESHHPALLPPIAVPCVDFAEMLRSYSPADHIVVKMDIEGAEFPVLRHLIAEGVIDRIKLLFIEWHVRLLKSETQNSRRQLEQQLRQSGVRLLPWS